MKYIFSILCLSLVGCFSSCNLFSEDDEPKTELEKLPPLTTTGENTFGCLVNGEAFVIQNTLDISAIYQGGGVQISASLDNNIVDQSILIILLDPIQINNIYDLTNLPDHKAQFRDSFTDNKCFYDYMNTISGFISLSKIDRTKFIISGTFEFSTVTQDCDTVTITDGRFDMQYIP